MRRAALPLLEQHYGVYYMPDSGPARRPRRIRAVHGRDGTHATLIARMVQESGAPVVFMFGQRLPWARGYIGHYFDAPEGIYSSDVTVSTTAMNQGLEKCVRACPEQYWWGYKRFRRQPSGQPDFYV